MGRRRDGFGWAWFWFGFGFGLVLALCVTKIWSRASLAQILAQMHRSGH
jgi:hypothetical protein